MPLQPTGDVPPHLPSRLDRNARIRAVLTIIAFASTFPACQFRSNSPQKVQPLAIGDQAPDFSLRDSQKPNSAPPISLTNLLQNGPVVLIFNMGLHCPACRPQDIEAFASQFDDFKKAGIQIVALSHEPPADTQDNLKSSPPIPFPLLFDPDNKTARSFGLETPDGTMDERTFLIDKDRRVLWTVKPDQPGGEIPELIKRATKSNPPH